MRRPKRNLHLADVDPSLTLHRVFSVCRGIMYCYRAETEAADGREQIQGLGLGVGGLGGWGGTVT